MKLIVTILTAILLFSLTGCGSMTTQDNDAAGNTAEDVNSSADGSADKEDGASSAQADPAASSSDRTSADSTTNTDDSTDMKNTTDDPNASVSHTNDNASTDDSSDNSSTGDTAASFYGQWEIRDVAAYSPASAYSNTDIEEITGKKIVFSEEQATAFGDRIASLNHTIENPEYQQTSLTSAQLHTDYRVTFEQLGVEGDSITQISASDLNGNNCTFFETNDHNRLILFGGGVFFELTRN